MSAPVRLAPEDAVELAELLELLAQLLDHAPHLFADVLARCCAEGYLLDELRYDLGRFAFLLAGHGERLVFGEDR